MSYEHYKQLCEQEIIPSNYQLNADFVGNVVVYDAQIFSEAIQSFHQGSEHQITLRTELIKELNHCLTKGAGVYVVRNGFSDHDLISRHNEVFQQIIQKEKLNRESSGDHFAKSGVNDRIWNSLQKTCLDFPLEFIDYYANDVLALASHAWLGPNYQMTAQVNVVKPGSTAQSPHRDYHLGFQSDELVMEFPLHAQVLSQYLTLQCVIAHSDMPVETGPTKILPFSHQYDLGYSAWRKKDFSEYFEAHYIQYPLQKGDIVFLNPAVFHAAGENKTQDVDRIANLMQIVSCMSKPLESIDRQAMANAVYPYLLESNMDKAKKTNIIAAVADGYSFPTNLDTDPPLGECAPQAMAELLLESIQMKRSPEQFQRLLDQQIIKRLA